KQAAIKHATQMCTDMQCLIEALLFDDEERKTIQGRLVQLYNHPDDRVFQRFLTQIIRPSKAYAFYERSSGATRLAAAWEDQHNGINYILRGYALGEGLRYPKVDSPIHDVRSKPYFEQVTAEIKAALALEDPLFFTASLYVAARLLVLNERDEAVRFRPLSAVNHAAYARIPTIDWDDAPYSVILVFGKGPKQHGVPLSRAGRQNLDRAVKFYRDRKAPFLVV